MVPRRDPIATGNCDQCKPQSASLEGSRLQARREATGKTLVKAGTGTSLTRFADCWRTGRAATHRDLRSGGLLGRAYWYALYPVRQLVFGGMLLGIAHRGEMTARLSDPADGER